MYLIGDQSKSVALVKFEPAPTGMHFALDRVVDRAHGLPRAMCTGLTQV